MGVVDGGVVFYPADGGSFLGVLGEGEGLIDGG